MARPKLPPYELGTVTTRAHPTATGMHQARGYYNDANHRRRDVTASGKSAAAAKRALAAKVAAARDTHRGGDHQLNERTRTGTAVAVWLDYAKHRKDSNGKRLSASTLNQYEGNIRRYVTGSSIELVPLGELNNVARIESWLSEIADAHGEGAATSARKVLSNTLALAERRGAIAASVMHRVETPGARKGSTGDRKCSDPDCDFDCGRRHLDTSRAFTRDELVTVMSAAEDSNADLADLLAFLFGTGARIREALHCVSWADLDLEARTVRIRGTKTEAADRTVMLSDELADRLAKRAETFGTKELVFGVTRYETKLGQPRDVSNVLRSVRLVLTKAGCDWAGSHSFRRTVATWMDDAGAPLGEIASQLGHASTAVTTRYLARKLAPTRAASVMTLASTEDQEPEPTATPSATPKAKRAARRGDGPDLALVVT